MKKHQFLIGVFVFVAAIFVFAAQAQAETIFGISAADSAGTSPTVNLVSFDSASPSAVTIVGPLSGITAGQQVTSIDFRIKTGQLFAISIATVVVGGNTFASGPAQLYTVDLGSGALTPIGPGFTLGTAGHVNSDPRVEIEIDPVNDVGRIITGTGKETLENNNFRVDLTTGLLIATDGDLAYASGDDNEGTEINSICATAYSNNFAGATTTTLWGWDYGLFDLLNTIGGDNVPTGTPSPNTGNMFSKFASNGLTTNKSIGMDISPNNGILYVTHDAQTGARMGLFTRSLTTGVQSTIGLYPIGTFIHDISVRRTPTASGVSVAGRVMTGDGRGLTNAIVTMTGSDGVSHTSITQRFGNYRFDNVESGQTYMMRVRSKRFSFTTQVLQVFDNLTDVDFTANGTAGRPTPGTATKALGSAQDSQY